MSLLKKLFGMAVDLIYPPRCAFCDRVIDGKERHICRYCSPKLPLVPLEAQGQKFKYIEKCVSPLYYNELVRDSLHRYKFSYETACADAYIDFLIKAIDENQISCDIITWVPLSIKRMRKRGYNQAAILGRMISKRKGIKCKGLLLKIKNNPPQSLTGDAAKRKQNAKGVYICHRPRLVSGKKILLVDDIVTTGATISECARMLKKAGAAEIYCITVARSMR